MEKQLNRSGLMKKTASIVLLALVIQIQARAQYYFYNDRYYDSKSLLEVGISTGGMNCITDISSGGAYKNINFSSSFYGDVIFSNVWGLRLEYTMGNVDAADSLNSKRSVRLRNLSFRSTIDEFALLGEFHPLMLFNFPSGPPRFSPYIMAGVGYFSFNPQTNYQGYWINLQTLHTEGEGFSEYPSVHNYKLSQLNFPVGCGLKYELSPIINIRLELLYRFLSTDYLDDVSTKFINPTLFSKYLSPQNATLAMALYSRRYEVQPGYTQVKDALRGDQNGNDAYYSFNLKLGVNLNRKRR